MPDPDPPHDSLLVPSVLSAPDMTYAALYSPSQEATLYAFPITLLVSAAVGWLVFQSGASADTTLTIMGYVLILGWWVKWAIVLMVFAYPSYQAWLLAGTWPGLSATHHLFTQDGIETIGKNGSSLYRWADISRAVETNKGFLFYRQGKIAAYVPTRSLAGAEEVAIVRKFIARNVADASLLARA